MCFDNQHAFIPFIFDTFDYLNTDTVDILLEVQKIMYNNCFAQLYIFSKGIIKKMNELSTVSGIDACAIIYDKKYSQTEVWPSTSEVKCVVKVQEEV
ncbi:hypothetical protein MTR_5g024430 [Medicago truncatula]|uniref:Uncharacterized protein n=1 Tax=Medicago truncatula TaxID=3880 RepID=G7K1A2_MEDTR|nr:hypothetical protein MTR_5g024430 [Medicago truncatula]